MSTRTTPATGRELPHAARSRFVRCPVCGRYLAAEERVGGQYCSAACAERYLRCTTCGRYYPATAATAGEHCSRECATRYSLHRSYGPAQVDIRMEDLL